MDDEMTNHYQDLVKNGGLAESLRLAMNESGLSFEGCSISECVVDATPKTDDRFSDYARIQKGERFSLVYISSKERMFEIEYGKHGVGWKRGLSLLNGQSDELPEVTRSIARWMVDDVPMHSLRAEFDLDISLEVIDIDESEFDTGCVIENRWAYYSIGPIQWIFPHLSELIEEAMGTHELRRLFPFTSFNSLCFRFCRNGHEESGCFEVSSVYLEEKDDFQPGQYELRLWDRFRKDHKLLGTGNTCEVVKMLVEHLPDDYEPVIF